LKRRVTRIGISAPTGSGKTTTIISLLPEIPLCGRGHQVLILVPTITIAKQVAKQIRKVYGNRYIVEKEYDGEHDNQSPDALPDM
jgi:superfamily II DNA or RNA helicase